MKNLRGVLSGVAVHAGLVLPDVTRPAGDADSGDSADFGILIGTYGGAKNAA